MRLNAQKRSDVVVMLLLFCAMRSWSGDLGPKKNAHCIFS